MTAMQDIHLILSKVQEYAAQAGVSPATVCRNATGNPRLFDRLSRRAEQTDFDLTRLVQFIDANPIEPSGTETSATRHVSQGAQKYSKRGAK
jgi:hypothetical protein